MTASRRLYLDNAATSFPKPPAVHEAMADYATRLGASPGRGAYAEAREAGELLTRCRQRINTLLNGQSADHVVFTLNTSDALNLAIRGILAKSPADRRHVVTTHLDHNSVLRPYNELAQRGDCTQTRVPVDPDTGLVEPDDIRAAITPHTCLVAVVHGSNVTGTVQPIRDIGRICREMAVPLLVDAAQTAGHLPIDIQEDCIDLLAAPGHKGLLGPLGTGFLYIRPGLEKHMATVREGGTGSVSELDTQPTFMPDRFEPGSHNAIGLIGLSEGVQFILDRGIDQLWAHEQGLIRTAIEGLNGDLPGLRYLGPQGVADRCGVFSIRIDTPDDTFADPAALADALESEFGILTRAGIHCAPLAHDAMQTRDRGGATRLSFGPFVQPQDVKYATDAIAELCHRYATTSAPA
ncbi:MAG: aminotransferase class V-fold PLP-dependent enzyme [Planctomycetota bacterium]